MSLIKAQVTNGKYTLSRIGADYCSDASYVDATSLLQSYTKREMCSVRGYWESPRGALACTFTVDLIGRWICYMPMCIVHPMDVAYDRMGRETFLDWVLRVAKPGTPVSAAYGVGRGLFHRLNEPWIKSQASSSLTMRRIG